MKFLTGLSLLFVFAFLAVIGGAILLLLRVPSALKPLSGQPQSPVPIPTAVATATPASASAPAETVASNLEIPWSLAWLPNRQMLVTERPGRLLLIGTDQRVIPIAGVAHRGEGGLLGIAVHPGFSDNHWLYLYLTSRQGDKLINRVERYELRDTTLAERTVIIDGIPGAVYHDGGRLAFGPDGLLYVTTGDAGQENLAQNTLSLAGKILRLRDDGTVPADNPFQNAVYSYGHRNVQGLAWDEQGRLWATEHGRSGVLSGLDEINLITPGSNYGWPTIQGDETRIGLTAPIIHSGPDTTWAPAGAAISGHSLYFAGLRGEALYEFDFSRRLLTAHLQGSLGRLRAVEFGPDGLLYLTTSNRDGRGQPRAGDDKIIRVSPTALRAE